MSMQAWRVIGGLVALAVSGFQIYRTVRGEKEGDSCRGTDASCVDAQSGLFCRDGKLMAVTCRAGCKEEGSDVLCDISENLDGDTCWNPTGTDETASCSPDEKEMVRCDRGRIARIPCRGPEGCSERGDQITCDHSIADVGDACFEEAPACSADKKAMLRCKDGQQTLERRCRGPEGCTVDGEGAIVCDESVADPGDSCKGDVSACTPDGKSMLRCRDGILELGQTCGSCEVKDDLVYCNP